MAVMRHTRPSLPFDSKFLFENLFKGILIKSNLINEMVTQLGQQMKNKMQVKVEINLVSHISMKCKL